MKNLFYNLKFRDVLLLNVFTGLFLISCDAVCRKNKVDFNGMEILNLLNGDKLHGNLISIKNNKQISWKYPNIANFINFPVKSIDSILLKNNRHLLASGPTYVYLTNDDFFPGRIISLDNTRLVISTDFGGKLVIPREMVKEITHSAKNRIIYHGPKEKDPWKQQNHGNNNQWIKIYDGVMNIPPRYWAICDVGLPDLSRVDIEIIDPGERTHFQFFCYTGDGHSGYFLTQNGSYFELERISRNEGTDSIESFEMSEVLNKPVLKLSLLFNKPKKQIILMFNNKVAGNLIDDASEFAGEGTSIAFFNTGRSSIRIKDILVAEWDGGTPNSGMSPAAYKNKDVIYFINRDKSNGKLEFIRNDNVSFKTDFGKFEVPIARIKKLVTATDGHHLARRNKNDIQTFLCGMGRLTFNLEKLTKNQIFGFSENFTNADFYIKYFKKFHFNIYQERSKNLILNREEEWNNLFNQKEKQVPAPLPRVKLKLLDENEIKLEDEKAGDHEKIEIIE